MQGGGSGPKNSVHIVAPLLSRILFSRCCISYLDEVGARTGGGPLRYFGPDLPVIAESPLKKDTSRTGGGPLEGFYLGLPVIS